MLLQHGLMQSRKDVISRSVVLSITFPAILSLFEA